jgi:hypothetical protein
MLGVLRSQAEKFPGQVQVKVSTRPDRAKDIRHFTVVNDHAFRFELTDDQKTEVQKQAAKATVSDNSRSWELSGQGSFNDPVTGAFFRTRFDDLFASINTESIVG